MRVFILICTDFEWDKFISDVCSFIYFIPFCFFQRSLSYFIISIALQEETQFTKILDLRYRNLSFYQAEAGQRANVVNFT